MCIILLPQAQIHLLPFDSREAVTHSSFSPGQPASQIRQSILAKLGDHAAKTVQLVSSRQPRRTLSSLNSLTVKEMVCLAPPGTHNNSPTPP